MNLGMKKRELVAIGALGLLVAVAPILWGFFFGVPAGVDRLAWMIACAASMADGVYRRKLKGAPFEYGIFGFVVLGGFFLVMWSHGFRYYSEPRVWGIGVVVDLLAYFSTSALLMWSQANSSWLGTQPTQERSR